MNLQTQRLKLIKLNTCLSPIKYLINNKFQMKNLNIKKVAGVDPLFQIAWIRSKECNSFAELKKTLKYVNKSFSY